MWEIFTCGRMPYAGVHVMGLLNVLKRGERLEKPENKACHDDMSVLVVTVFYNTISSHKLNRAYFNSRPVHIITVL